MSGYKRGYLSEFFDGFAAKRLTAVEVDPSISNQHEFQGVHRLRQILGMPSEKVTFKSTYIWLDDNNESEAADGFVTWSDVRRDNPNRSAEYHLYYSAQGADVVYRSSPGDLLLVARKKDGTLLIVLVPAGSTVEKQLSWLFDFPLGEGESVFIREMNEEHDREIGFAANFILDELGIESIKADENWLEQLIEKFGDEFPSTALFSAFARDTLKGISALDDPDEVLLEWLSHEEMLFKTFEKHIVTNRLQEGFYDDKGADVDGFISFSLSVQNRRKSRAGYAIENHIEPIFRARKIKYERDGKTEHRVKPDFLFPGSAEYHDNNFPDNRLSILGVKSTCKDRWRQVLSEAARVQTKHLLTLEPGISENQTTEMRGNNLQLVLPSPLHDSYTEKQQQWLYSFEDFINHVIKKQK